MSPQPPKDAPRHMGYEACCPQCDTLFNGATCPECGRPFGPIQVSGVPPTGEAVDFLHVLPERTDAPTVEKVLQTARLLAHSPYEVTRLRPMDPQTEWDRRVKLVIDAILEHDASALIERSPTTDRGPEVV